MAWFHSDTIKTARESLMRKQTRTFLTMLAISIGIAAVIIIMAAGRGIQRFVLSQLDAFGPDTMFVETRVPSQKKNSGGFGSVGITITTLKDRDITSILSHPNVSIAYGVVNGQESVSHNGQIKKIMLMGRGGDAPLAENLPLVEGRFFTTEEERGASSVAVLGSKAKDKLFGNDDASGRTIHIRGKTFQVVGVLEPRGSAFFVDMDNVILLPTRTMQKKLLGIDYVQGIMVKMRDGSASKSTAEDIAALIRDNHSITDPDRDDFVVNTTADAQETLTTVTGGITLLLVALVCISLIVGGVGIMNIMYVSVVERTFEIGLRKALGATRSDILRQFLTEAVLLTLGGGGIGIVIGAFVAWLVALAALSQGFAWVYEVPPSSVLLSVSFSAVIGIFFGYYPARKAAALDPVEALRRE